MYSDLGTETTSAPIPPDGAVQLRCVAYHTHPVSVQALVKEKAIGARSLEDLVKRLSNPRALWMMVPAAAVDATLAALFPLLDADDVVIDGVAIPLEEARILWQRWYLRRER